MPAKTTTFVVVINPGETKNSNYLLARVKSLEEAPTIHLHQQLVEGVLPLIMPSKAPCPPSLPPHCINLIDEDDTGSILPCLAKEIPYSGRTNTHKHLQELGTGDAQKGDFSLSSSGLSKQCFTCTWGARQNGSLQIQ